MAAPGTDIVLTDDRLAGSRNFANKIWNAARFLFVNLDKFEQAGASLEELASPAVRAKAPYSVGGSVPLVDAWIFDQLASTIETINDALANYRFHEAAQSVYQFFWGDFCDWYIEWVKPELQNTDRERATVAWKNLFAIFDAALRLLHPLMPFLTEELWHQLPQAVGAKSIALQAFPEAVAEWKAPQARERFALIQQVIGEFREIRAQMKLEAKKKVPGDFSAGNAELRNLITEHRDGLQRLAFLSDLKISAEHLPQDGGLLRSTAQFDARVANVAETADSALELPRLRKEIDRISKDIASKEKQLGDPTFRSRAPEKIILGMEVTLLERRVELNKLSVRLAQIEKSS
jgi:valyl-tRNA synthetase